MGGVVDISRSGETKMHYDSKLIALLTFTRKCQPVVYKWNDIAYNILMGPQFLMVIWQLSDIDIYCEHQCLQVYLDLNKEQYLNPPLFFQHDGATSYYGHHERRFQEDFL